MSLKDKLNRLKVHMTQEEPQPAIAHSAKIPFLEKWAGLQAKPYVYNDDYVMVREVRYPVTQQHGKYTFDQLHEVIEAWEKTVHQHPLSSMGRTAADLLFFDTETTGLHGGAGNTIFLLGYSRMEGDAVVVRQHFLAAPHAEVSLYQSFLADINESKHLVTYNGKAFDWPQVKTRHTLIRDLVPRLPSFGHCDLLHGARRLWRNELESCRLSIIEQEKLGVFRKDDVPGYLAPMLYFDYLRHRDPETIQGVLYHNEIDVLSLITLYIHISKLLLEYGRDVVSHNERFEIARWYEALGEDTHAVEGYKKIAESDHALRGKAKIALGHHYKKQKKWKPALEIWEECIHEFTYVPENVYVEAAKIYEHQVKDYEKALHYTLLAFDEWKKKKNLLRRGSKAEQETYWKRIERLEQRIHQRA
ncbi:ribonuclease H-like domain-containing protein [Effusibacillus dendaii]|uniref:YprB ribonuclease H-like domain-containing protein n=1 Tax=Effusibacillus dendaii TaxID=2743772 RepID=A0A7I8D690_9BACL|nr:ribonuclease H-like domain-containing protein [Effusibacillus dendaii]BCJ85644.1 hypothetical protein skT53_06290 [Effusibacillus dendaii]